MDLCRTRTKKARRGREKDTGCLTGGRRMARRRKRMEILCGSGDTYMTSTLRGRGVGAKRMK